MKNVIGPISSIDWKVMLDLKGSLEYLKKEDSLKYSSCIEKETILLKEIKGKYIQ